MFSLRAAIVLAIGLIAYLGLRRASAATRRSVLVAALGASLIVPLVARLLPSWHVAAPQGLQVLAHESALEGVVATAAPVIVTAAPVETSSSLPILLFAWLAGVAVLLARLAASHLRVRRIARGGVPFGPGLLCAGIDSPALYGSRVLLPLAARTWSAEQLEMVVRHEQAHARQRDPLAQFVADIACAVHWVNPLAWLAAARLRVEREHAADDAVIASGVRASSYAEVLLSVAGARTAGALAMAERTTLGERIVRILAPSRRSMSRAWIAALGAVALALGGFAACASIDPPAESPRATDASAQAAAEQIAKSLAVNGAPAVLVLDADSGAVLASVGPTGTPIITGSTLKPLTIAAALDAGAITTAQTFDCAPRRYGDKELRDPEVNGVLDAAHILAVSSNTGTSRIVDALGVDKLAETLAKFDLPVPHPTGDPYQSAQFAIGESMPVAPVALAQAYASLANGRVVSAQTSQQVLAMMHAVVAEGTGKKAAVAGVDIAGKTGTAVFGEHTYASFVGIAQLPSRRVVALVGVDTLRHDLSGGQVAAPAFAQLITKLQRP